MTNIKNTIKNANLGKAQDQYTLGMAYYKGDGVKQNYEQALQWLKKCDSSQVTLPTNGKSIKDHITHINYKIGEMYFTKDKNIKTALYHYTQAADGGCID